MREAEAHGQGQGAGGLGGAEFHPDMWRGLNFIGVHGAGKSLIIRMMYCISNFVLFEVKIFKEFWGFDSLPEIIISTILTCNNFFPQIIFLWTTPFPTNDDICLKKPFLSVWFPFH